MSDLFDFSVYVDARTSDIASWYVERFLRLQRGAFADPQLVLPPLRRPQARGGADDGAAASGATINEPNLRENILPTRSRATLVLRKAADHAVSRCCCASSEASADARSRTSRGLHADRATPGLPRDARLDAASASG